MRILALDTSTLAASVAVVVDGRVAAEREARVTTHSEMLLPMIDAALAEAGAAAAELDAIACGAGPGSFTGLRIGLATAKGLGFALGRPLVVVSSLAALALEGEEEARRTGDRVLALLDARRGEVFAGVFRLAAGAPEPCAPEAVLPPDRLPAWIAAASGAGGIVVVGDGAAAYPAAAAAAGRILDGARPTPRAAAVARIAAPQARSQAPERLAGRPADLHPTVGGGDQFPEDFQGSAPEEPDARGRR